MQDVLSIPSVTGVDLNLRIAGPGARSYAFILDWHIRLLAALAWLVAGMLLAFGSLSGLGEGAGTGFVMTVVLPSAAIYFLYHPIVEVLMAGQSPGKRIAGVRVVRTTGAIPGIGAILIRNVFRLIDSLPAVYCVGLATTVFTQQSVRIGDIAAGTVLVYDNAEDKELGDLPSEAIGRIGMEQVELVRELLARWDSLSLEVRNDLAWRLLRKLGEEHNLRVEADLRSALEAVLSQQDKG